MIDIQFIRDNPALVQEKSKQKGYVVDTAQLLDLDEKRRRMLADLEDLRAKRNDNAAKMKGGKPDPELVKQGKLLKIELSEAEVKFKVADEEFYQLLRQVPNMPLDDVPIGVSEDENKIAKTVGVPREFDFEPKHHHEIAEPRDLIDKERAAKVAGSRFAYIKGGLALMQFALIQFVMQTLTDEKVIQKIIEENSLKLSSKPFVPIIPPALIRTEPYAASARLNAEEVTYKLADDDLWLNASAEHSLCTMYWNEILPEDQLPIRYIGYSTSFRREAGTYGKDTEGIFRMHQFDKLEMEAFSTAETGLAEHYLQVAIQEYLMQQLQLPYQLINKCTFDIGKPNARGLDINAWFPAQKTYRETHTADYITDYQSRDLKIRVRRGDGRLELVHTNDATAFAMGRTMAAIIENYQTKDGHIVIPDILRTYMGHQTQI